MPQGLQVYDENGNVIVDVTTQLTNVAGQIALSTSLGDSTHNRSLPVKFNNLYYTVLYNTIGDSTGISKNIFEVQMGLSSDGMTVLCTVIKKNNSPTPRDVIVIYGGY